MQRRPQLTLNEKDEGLAAIARELNVTPERIRQIERKALEKLRRALGARFNARSVDDLLPDQHGEAMPPPAVPRR